MEMDFNLDYQNILYAIVVIFPFIFTFLSLLLLERPDILHKKINLGVLGKHWLIGHRGSRLEGLPENTIASFKDACKQAKILELDVWLTKDYEVIIHHDENFTRMTNGKVTNAVYHHNYSEIPDIHPPEDQNHRIHEFHHEEVRRIPLFEDLLKVLPEDVHLIIEFKQDSDLLIVLVRNLLLKYNRLRPVQLSMSGLQGKYECGQPHSNQRDIWFSLNNAINDKLYKCDPSICRIASIFGMLKIVFYYLLGILPFISIKESAIGFPIQEVTMQRIQNEKSMKHVPYFLQWLLYSVVRGVPPRILMQPKMFSHLRKRGLMVMFMFVNTEEELEMAANAGVTAILSDCVHKIAEIAKTKQIKFKTV